MSKPKQAERRELWRQRIAQHEKSGQSVRAFCREQKWNEHSFYWWRKELGGTTAGGDKPMRFALVETIQPGAPQPQHDGSQHVHLELVLTGGDRLRIPADAATLEMVLSVLRKHS